MNRHQLRQRNLRWRLLTAIWLVGVLGWPNVPGYAAEDPDAETRAGWQQMSEYGNGFVVWESNRSGRWRIWRRNLDGMDPRQLVPDENGRDHFCPHVSPDGIRMIYVSYPAGKSEYVAGQPKPEIALHLIGVDGSSDKVLIASARAYGGDRAVVWFDNRRFAYIDAEGFTQEFDLDSGKSRRLTADGQKEGGFLINAAKTHATTGSPTFSPFNQEQSRISSQAAQPGCEPYFTHDGRWWFWMGGAGGPINRFELQSRQVSPILNKDDPRMPKGRQYLYFPMVSRDGRFLTFAASPNQHDHDKSDYDVFVTRLDPKTLEVLDRPVRYSFDSATDRYPDVYAADLELGRFAGESPFSVSFPALKPDGEWTWDFGDGATANGAMARHTYSRPGEYRVAARQKDRVRFAVVSVAPAAPPKVLAATVTAPTEVVVAFDEPIQLQNGSARFESGAQVAELFVAKDSRRLIIRLTGKLTKADVLHLTGIADAAERPNVISPQRLAINPSSWPANREGLVFLYETGDKPNQVPARDGRPARSYPLRLRGRARWNHDQAMVLTGGSFVVEGADDDLLAACRQSQQLTIEAVIHPDHLSQTGPARIVTFSSSTGSRDFTLGQEKNKLIFRLRTPAAGENGVNPETQLTAITVGEPLHVAVTYRPGQLVAYVNGTEVYRGNSVQGDFSNWSPHHLLFGDEFEGQRNWAGSLEGIALYSRTLEPAEVQQNANEYRRLVNSRPAVPQIEVTARLIAKSLVPTLDEVKPYRGAMMTSKYEVVQVLRGKLSEKEVLVKQWALLDGQPQPVAALKPGGELRLVLEPAELNPQLQRFVCKDSFESDAELLLPRYYDATP